jgi:hypothetical protein
MVTVFRCPRDPNIFPALQVERGVRDLFADFKAFRFPSTATVNFVATVQFCQDICEPVSKVMLSVYGIMYVILFNAY